MNDLMSLSSSAFLLFLLFPLLDWDEVAVVVGSNGIVVVPFVIEKSLLDVVVSSNCLLEVVVDSSPVTSVEDDFTVDDDLIVVVGFDCSVMITVVLDTIDASEEVSFSASASITVVILEPSDKVVDDASSMFEVFFIRSAGVVLDNRLCEDVAVDSPDAWVDIFEDTMVVDNVTVLVGTSVELFITSSWAISSSLALKSVLKHNEVVGLS